MAKWVVLPKRKGKFMLQKRMENLAEDQEKEIWNPVAGYKGWYSISNLGRVRRDKKSRGAKVGKIIKLRKSHNGYIQIDLHRHMMVKTTYVHRLVMNAFIGVAGKNKETNHIDGNKGNNNLSNLEYVTKRENLLHSYRIGTHQKPNLRGENNPFSRLREKEVVSIRKIYSENNISQIKLSKMFNVNDATINNIIKRRSWKHLI